MLAFISANLQGYQDTLPLRRAASQLIGLYSIGANTNPLTLRLAPSPSISGVVRGPDHSPFAHGWVALWWYRTWAGWRQMEYCNYLANGCRRVLPLPVVISRPLPGGR
jgi:hypothetical protein